MPTRDALAHAHELLARHPVLDTHNDLPFALRDRADRLDPGSDPLTPEVATGLAGTHTDLPRLRAGRVGGQFWSAYVPASWAGERAVAATLEQVDLVRRMVTAHPDRLAWCLSATDVEAAIGAGRIASLVGLEGGHSLGGSLGVLRALHALGARYLTLTHNDTHDWADSATDAPRHGGLADLGRRVVEEMNRLGMLVDLSHVAATTMHDALDVSAAPVIFSHSSCRAVADHPRNVPDDVLQRLPGNGGVLCVTFVPAFVSPAAAAFDLRLRDERDRRGLDRDDWDAVAALSHELGPEPEADLTDVVAHLEHARRVVGPGHLGLGGDYDGTPTLPEGLSDVTGYPRLVAALVERGWSDDELAGLTCRNVLRVLRRAEQVATSR